MEGGRTVCVLTATLASWWGVGGNTRVRRHQRRAQFSSLPSVQYVDPRPPGSFRGRWAMGSRMLLAHVLPSSTSVYVPPLPTERAPTPVLWPALTD